MSLIGLLSQTLDSTTWLHVLLTIAELLHLDLLQGLASVGASGASKDWRRHIRTKLLPVEADAKEVPAHTCSM